MSYASETSLNLDRQTADLAEALPPLARTRLRRAALTALGLLATLCALIGIVVPGWPTTIFAIIALWAFERSSPRLRRWLYAHACLGPLLRAWKQHGAVPFRAKVLACSMMAASVAMIALTTGSGWATLGLGAVLVPVALYVVSRPDAGPDA